MVTNKFTPAGSMIMDRVDVILRAAADWAEREPTLEKAIRAGWSACHADRELIGQVFRRWAAGEDYAGPLPDLGGVLRRRYRKQGPGAIAESLRKASGI